MLHCKQVFGNVFERRESRCCAALMKQHGKVKGKQIITLEMVHDEKPLQILTMDSLNVKHQGKNSNQLAFHPSPYTHL